MIPFVQSLTFQINTSSPIFQTSSKFLSWTMDASETNKWGKEKDNFWYNQTILNLAKNLGASHFRYGGTSADITAYNFSGTYFPIHNPTDRATLVMNNTVFDGLHDFTKTVGWDLIYGVNLGTYRNSQNEWVDAAFSSMLDYVIAKNYSIFGWELGNEPDLFYRHNMSVEPYQSSKDYELFHQTIQNKQMRKKNSSMPLIIGPDVAGAPNAYFIPFLDHVKDEDILDVATYHFYYGPGSSVPDGLTIKDFYNPIILDRFLDSATSFLKVSNSRLNHNSSKNRELWVGETSSTYGGGTGNTSASFVAGFMWLDKLALAANLQHSVVCRQVFGHAQYAAVGYDNVPNPDYYTALLWQRLVGNKVLSVQNGLKKGREVRVYAFCASAKQQPEGGGAVTMVFLNTKNETVVSMNFTSEETLLGLNSEQHVYTLTSFKGLPTSRSVYLNEKILLSVDSKTGVPVEMPPVILKENINVVVAPLSYGFIVLPNAKVEACQL